jgi:hypothetical protein
MSKAQVMTTALGQWILVVAFAASMAVAGPARPAEIAVGLELVLAADVSGPMDDWELALQRQGHLRALTSPRVIKAIQRGQHRPIAIAFVEWAGLHW